MVLYLKWHVQWRVGDEGICPVEKRPTPGSELQVTVRTARGFIKLLIKPRVSRHQDSGQHIDSGCAFLKTVRAEEHQC